VMGTHKLLETLKKRGQYKQQPNCLCIPTDKTLDCAGRRHTPYTFSCESETPEETQNGKGHGNKGQIQ
jgi:hypothetical protein